MKLRMKLASTCLALLLTVGLLVVGVLASSQATVGIGGSVSFVATDVYARVTGEISGTYETGDDIKLEELNFSAYIDKPAKELTDTWENKTLNFLNKNTSIEIDILVENLSTERALYVDLYGDVETKDNMVKTLLNENGAYEKGKIITIPKSTEQKISSTTFTIKLDIKNKNYAINSASYDYVLTLDNENRSLVNTSEKYSLDFDFVDVIDANILASQNTSFGEGNVYEITDGYAVYAYILSGEKDILNPIEKGVVNIKIYTGYGCEIFISENSNSISYSYSEDDDMIYSIYSFDYDLQANANITIEGMLFEIFN